MVGIRSEYQLEPLGAGHGTGLQLIAVLVSSDRGKDAFTEMAQRSYTLVEKLGVKSGHAAIRDHGSAEEVRKDL